MYKKTTPMIITNYSNAELIKYSNNSFLATKISFINQLANICQKIPNSNVDIVANAIGLDPRIGNTHTMVPGPDGDFGYGGHCFPKDMAAILNVADELSTSLPTLFGASTTNAIVRQNRDWEEMKGRAVSENENLEKTENTISSEL